MGANPRTCYAVGMREFPFALRVRVPCDVSSDELAESSEGWRCASCEKIVHDLSKLTFDEAESLFRAARRSGSSVCSEMLVRPSDGAVLLADGYARPGGMPSKRRLPLANAVAAASAVMLAACATTPLPVPELAAPPQASPRPSEPMQRASGSTQPSTPTAPQSFPDDPITIPPEPPEDPSAKAQTSSGSSGSGSASSSGGSSGTPAKTPAGPATKATMPKKKDPKHEMLRGDVAF